MVKNALYHPFANEHGNIFRNASSFFHVAVITICEKKMHFLGNVYFQAAIMIIAKR